MRNTSSRATRLHENHRDDELGFGSDAKRWVQGRRSRGTVSANRKASGRASSRRVFPSGCEEEVDRLVLPRDFVPICHRDDNRCIVIADRYTARHATGRLIRGRFLLAMTRYTLLALGLLTLKRAVRGCYWMTQNAKHDDECSRG